MGACLFMLPQQVALGQPETGLYHDLTYLDDLLIPKVSEITLGAGGKYEPDYIGSDDYEIRPKFALYMRFKDFLTLENGGATFDILGVNNFEFGPVLHITEGRNSSVNDALRGLNDVQRSLDIGVFAKFTIADHFVGRIRYFNDIFAGKNGSALEFSVKTLLYNKGKLSLFMELTCDWVDTKRAMTFFGITPEQAVSSGLPEYQLNHTFQDGHAEIEARWNFTQNWSLNGYVHYTSLRGDVSRSPLIKAVGSPNQVIIGTYATYTFFLDEH